MDIAITEGEEELISLQDNLAHIEHAVAEDMHTDDGDPGALSVAANEVYPTEVAAQYAGEKSNHASPPRKSIVSSSKTGAAEDRRVTDLSSGSEALANNFTPFQQYNGKTETVEVRVYEASPTHVRDDQRGERAEAEEEKVLASIFEKTQKLEEMHENFESLRREIKDWGRDFYARTGRVPNREDKREARDLFLNHKKVRLQHLSCHNVELQVNDYKSLYNLTYLHITSHIFT